MAEKTFASDFSDWMLPELAGVPSPLVTFHLRAAATSFFQTTGIYTALLTPITLVVNTATYTFAGVPTGYEPIRTVEVKFGDQPLTPRSQTQLRNMFMNWETLQGPPIVYTQETTDSIRFVPYPEELADETVSVRVALRPTKAATGIVDWIFNGWADVIAAGAKARLMAMPQKPWTDIAGASENRGNFRAGVSRALIDSNRSLTSAPLHVMMRKI